jgi:glycosyltransferase involved in cell wall biosynthesis
MPGDSPNGSAPEVSVLMSVRNGVPYLTPAVASIAAQTFTDWEFVIVDNASQDGTWDELEAWARRDPRIRLLRNSRDLGHSGGLNRGLGACRGRWVARLDADDIALPEWLAKGLQFARAHPQACVISCLAYLIDSTGKRVSRVALDVITPEKFREYTARNEMIGILHSGTLIERSILTAVGGYRPAFDPANDSDLWARIADHGGMILVQPEYLMEYRIQENSVTTQSYERLRLKHQWAKACMRARRGGRPEPTWEEFLGELQSAPWWQRVNHRRKLTAKRLYRRAGQHCIARRPVLGAVEMVLAIVLEPGYAMPRIRSHLLG